jgi:phosphopantetheinyl transferase
MAANPVLADVSWPLLDHSRPPRADEVLVLALNLDQTPADTAVLADHERARAARLHSELLRRRHLAAHVALRQILGWRLALAPGALNFTRDRHGKPSLRHHPLAFNLSHSGGWALVAVADDGVLGVDVELGERLRDVESLAGRMLTDAALAAFLALPPAQKPATFLTTWTRKEAVLKALGVGLPGGMEHVHVAEDPLRVVGDDTHLPGVTRLHLHDLPRLGDGYAALCQGPTARRPVCRRWSTVATSTAVQQLPSGPLT